jgi:hypothetical protein
MIALAAPVLAACGDGGTSSGGSGSVALSIEAEDAIPEGLEPGNGPDDITDGWAVRFEQLLFTAGAVHAASSEQDVELSDSTIQLLDLTAIPATGSTLLEADDADAVRYDDVSFENPVAEASFELGPSVTAEDLDRMVENGWSIYVAGEITKDDGESCTPGSPDDCTPATRVRFAWGGAAGTTYEHCGPEEGDLGFAVTSGGSTGATFTIHGDHWFFNGFPEGEEIIMRRAQWIADVDLDHDGEATREELENTRASDVFPSARYSLAGSPIPITTAYDFFIAQSHTLGHFQGEGECEWVVR